MIVGTIRILPLSDRRADVIEMLRSVRGPVRVQPGCVACDIYEEHEGRTGRRLHGTVGFRGGARRRTCGRTCTGRVLGAVELSGQRPGIRFERVGTSEGIEMIERHRLPAGTRRRERRRIVKVIIVGGVAGGASCAARLRRLDEKAEILMVERGPYVSYANCGLPYHVGA